MIDVIMKGGKMGEKGEIGDGKIFVFLFEDCICICIGE